MPAADPVLAVVIAWVLKAEGDLKNASHTLKLGTECPTDTVGFHAQQCVEKYLKAVLVLNGVAFPRIHDIEELVRLTPVGVLADWPISEQRRLTQYAVVTRYPGGYASITLADAKQAVRIARRVRSELRRLLPKAALKKLTASPRRPKR